MPPLVAGSLDDPPMRIRTGLVKFGLGVAAGLAVAGYFLEVLREDPTLTLFWLPVVPAVGWAGWCMFRMWRSDRLELSPAGLRYLTFLGVIVDVPWAQIGPF